jgi:tetratricopeptide (TPR) repeat protein
MREQLALADEMGSKLMACMALGNLGTVVASGDRFEESLECYRRAVKLASQLGTVQHEAIARSNLAEHCRPLGLVGEALENMEKAVSIVREKAMTVYLGAFLSSYAAVLCDAGRLDEASQAMSEARGLLALEETVRHDEMDIVEARLVAGDDPEAAVGILEDVMGRDRCSLCSSDAATLRWQITGSERHRLEAVEACHRQLEENFTPWRARLNLKKLGEDPAQPGGRAPAAGEEAG